MFPRGWRNVHSEVPDVRCVGLFLAVVLVLVGWLLRRRLQSAVVVSP
jgi:hypothetical protein